MVTEGPVVINRRMPNETQEAPVIVFCKLLAVLVLPTRLFDIEKFWFGVPCIWIYCGMIAAAVLVPPIVHPPTVLPVILCAPLDPIAKIPARKLLTAPPALIVIEMAPVPVAAPMVLPCILTLPCVAWMPLNTVAVVA